MRLVKAFNALLLLVRRNYRILSIIVAFSWLFNFLFTIVYMAPIHGYCLYRNLLSDFRVVATLPRATDAIGLKIFEERMAADRHVKDVIFVSSDEAWEKLNGDSRLNAKFAEYSGNSLPHTFFVIPDFVSVRELQSLIERIQGQGEPSEVLYDSVTLRWLEIIARNSQLLYTVFLGVSGVIAALTIALGVLFLLMNQAKKMLPCVFVAAVFGCAGAYAGFWMSYLFLKNSPSAATHLQAVTMANQLFALAGSCVAGCLVALFAAVASREFKTKAV